MNPIESILAPLTHNERTKGIDSIWATCYTISIAVLIPFPLSSALTHSQSIIHTNLRNIYRNMWTWNVGYLLTN